MQDFTAEEVRRFLRRSALRGTLIFTTDAFLYGAAVVGAVLAEFWWLRLALGFTSGLLRGLLFVVGHDACHHSLTGNRALDQLLGRLAFLPSLHPYSLWDLGHNRSHHRYTNQRHRDYVWEPLSPAEYRRLPRWRRAKYRFYRSPLGHCWYYLLEIWWRKMFFPRVREVGPYRRAYWLDLALVTAWLFALPPVLMAACACSQGWESFAKPVCWFRVVSFGVVIPFLFFNVLLSAVVFLHHTHPEVKWYPPDDSRSWHESQLRSSVHVVFPGPINWVFHRIMKHAAHHLRPSIPLYHLWRAQEAIVKKNPGVVVAYQWSPRAHFLILNRCKLFDLEHGTWVGFGGCMASDDAPNPQEAAAWPARS